MPLREQKRRAGSEGVRRAVTIAAAAVLVILLALLVHHIQNRTYTGYKVVRSSEKSGSVSKWEYTPAGAVRYSTDGASLLNGSLKTVWSVTYTMNDPRLSVCGNECLIYDCKGTSALLFNEKGKTGAFSTELPIGKACVSAKGTVAALLDNGDTTEFAYYTSDGSKIASGSSTITDPGYPAALALSDDGLSLAVSYLTAADGNIGTTVRAYRFSSDQSEGCRESGELSFTGSFVPALTYIGDSLIIVRDGGLTVCRGTDKLKQTVDVDFDEEIVSMFSDGSHIGFVFRSTEKGHRYTARLYSGGGQELAAMNLDDSYQTVHACGDMLVFSSGSGISVYSMRGVCRYHGPVREGSVTDAVRVDSRRLLVVTDQALEVIELR